MPFLEGNRLADAFLLGLFAYPSHLTARGHVAAIFFDLFVYAGPNDPPNHQRNESEDGKTRVDHIRLMGS
jgi:hypothetical protein